MRRFVELGIVLAAALADPASAMDRYGAVTGGSRVAVADPDARLERLAAASTPTPTGNGRPGKAGKSIRGILKNDPALRAAYAWLDNH